MGAKSLYKSMMAQLTVTYYDTGHVNYYMDYHDNMQWHHQLSDMWCLTVQSEYFNVAWCWFKLAQISIEKINVTNDGVSFQSSLKCVMSFLA